MSQQRVSYGEIHAQQRASLGLNNPRPTVAVTSSSSYESPEYHVPSPMVIDLSPGPALGSEASPPAELVEMVDDLNNLPLPNH